MAFVVVVLLLAVVVAVEAPLRPRQPAMRRLPILVQLGSQSLSCSCGCRCSVAQQLDNETIRLEVCSEKLKKSKKELQKCMDKARDLLRSRHFLKASHRRHLRKIRIVNFGCNLIYIYDQD